MVDRRVHVLLIGAFLALGLLVPMTALGAGDDCPPPSETPLEDPGYVPPEDPPTGGESGGNGGGGGEETTSEDGGTFGSLSSMSSGQLTIGILAVVGVIVGAVYFFMVSRMDEDDILEP
ncbi:MAG: hypothetical protein JSW25_07390 [Thermoplasmata archaeon]|nr:MAG: hypothetical protein JSW25_07390 [Thermoplasmata archaeon]